HHTALPLRHALPFCSVSQNLTCDFPFSSESLAQSLIPVEKISAEHAEYAHNPEGNQENIQSCHYASGDCRSLGHGHDRILIQQSKLSSQRPQYNCKNSQEQRSHGKK